MAEDPCPPCSRHVCNSPLHTQTARPLLHLRLHPCPKHAEPPRSCPGLTVPSGSTQLCRGQAAEGVSWQAAQRVGEKSAQGPQGLSEPAGSSPVSGAGCLFSRLLAQHSPQQHSASTARPSLTPCQQKMCKYRKRGDRNSPCYAPPQGGR